MGLYKINNIIAFTILFICALSSFTKADFPDDPKPCKYGDSDCLVKTMNSFIQNKANGDPSINLSQIDPLKVSKISIKQGADSPVNIDLTFTNNDLFGPSTGTVTEVKGFGKDLTGKHEIHILYKKLQLIGDYTIKGKILILPIAGTGKSNLTMVDTEAVYYFSGTPIEKDGETYMGVKNLVLTLKPKRMYYHFDNLFNGDKELGDNMNLFLNENWSDIFNEAKVSTEKAFRKVYQNVIHNVFQKIPYNKYFSE